MQCPLHWSLPPQVLLLLPYHCCLAHQPVTTHLVWHPGPIPPQMRVWRRGEALWVQWGHKVLWENPAQPQDFHTGVVSPEQEDRGSESDGGGSDSSEETACVLVRGGASLWARTRSTLKHQGNPVPKGEGTCQRLPHESEQSGGDLSAAKSQGRSKTHQGGSGWRAHVTQGDTGRSAQCQTAVRAEPDLWPGFLDS